MNRAARELPFETTSPIVIRSIDSALLRLVKAARIAKAQKNAAAADTATAHHTKA